MSVQIRLRCDFLQAWNFVKARWGLKFSFSSRVRIHKVVLKASIVV